MNPQQLEQLVHSAVAAQLAKSSEKPSAFTKIVDAASGVMAVKTATVKPQPFDTGKAGDKVFLQDVFTLQESPRLGCGVMEMEKSTFDWHLNYDEVDVVLEGRLSINIDGRQVSAEQGEILFIPKDTSIQFSVPEYAKFIYVTWPADWDQQ